jgi:hypothetical protein
MFQLQHAIYIQPVLSVSNFKVPFGLDVCKILLWVFWGSPVLDVLHNIVLTENKSNEITNAFAL